MIVLQGHRWIWQDWTIEACFAVNMLGCDKLAHQGRVATREDFNIRFACQLTDYASIFLSKV
jgi:hypothetical protein